MIIRLLVPALAFAGTLAAQTFIQMSLFGTYTKNEGFAHETVNFDFAIATANRLKPAFVIMTGYLINKPGCGAGRRVPAHRREARSEDSILQSAGEPRRQ
jgi:hypothetical protein